MEEETKWVEPKNSNGLRIAILAVIVLVGLVAGKQLFQKEKMAPKTMETKTEATPSPTTASQMILISEIEKHATKTDCWFAVEGNVYDVTKYIASGMHKGGEAILAGCGKDATELFKTRPMGSGTPHSEKAYGYLANFQIGTLGQ